MATKVIMPKQGLQMTEGTILCWNVPEGGVVKKGEPLFEIETDKLVISIDAECDGTLLKIIRKEGERVPITETIAVIGEPGENIDDFLCPDEQCTATAGADTKNDRILATPRAKMRAAERGVALDGICGSGPDGLVIERDVNGACSDASGRRATPLARKTALQQNIDLEAVHGTGAHGKITRSDVLAAAAPEMPAASAAAAQSDDVRIVPYTGMRRIIGEKMMRSLQTQAQLCHTVSVDMSNAVSLRETFKRHGSKVSYTDIILFVVARALTEFPVMNSRLTERGIEISSCVNLGVATSLDNGLIVPVIPHAEKRRIEEISAMATDLAERARTNRLQPDEYQGGTFTVSSLGMFGIESFTAILNTPESGILAVGAIEKRPVVRDDTIVIRPMMNLTLTFDHRVMDGVPAAQFLGRVKAMLEEPYLLL